MLNIIGEQSVFSCVLRPFLTVEAAGPFRCPEPHRTIRVCPDAENGIIDQTVFGSETGPCTPFETICSSGRCSNPYSTVD